MRSRRPSSASVALVASALVAGLAMLPHVPVPVRAIAIVGFALVCPGLAWIRLLGIDDRLAVCVLGVALSISIGTLVVTLQAYAGAWSPRGSIAILAAVVVAAALTELVTAADGREAR